MVFFLRDAKHGLSTFFSNHTTFSIKINFNRKENYPLCQTHLYLLLGKFETFVFIFMIDKMIIPIKNSYDIYMHVFLYFTF